MNSIPNGYIGFCSFCILNLNANMTPFVGAGNTGLAKDMEGMVVTFRSGNKLKWKPGISIPPGGTWMSDIFFAFGDSVDLRRPGTGEKVAPWAITMRAGNYVCEPCNGSVHLSSSHPGRGI